MTIFELSLRYSILIFLAVTGVLHAIAAYRGLKGISFFTYKISAYIFAAITIIPPLAIFFTWNERWPIGLIQGPEQFYCFIAGTIVALVFTLGLSSILKRTSITDDPGELHGISALKNMTYYQAIKQLIRSKGSNCSK